jgi:hypothetical protein
MPRNDAQFAGMLNPLTRVLFLITQVIPFKETCIYVLPAAGKSNIS